jgi:1-phosphatidylinositol-4-phosphate 5-kinase
MLASTKRDDNPSTTLSAETVPATVDLPAQLPPSVPSTTASPKRRMSYPVTAPSPPHSPERSARARRSGSTTGLERPNSRSSFPPRGSSSLTFQRQNSRHRGSESALDSLDEDAQKWTEEIRRKRERKRRLRELEDGDRVIIGNKVDADHPNYVTAYSMLTGLRVAVCSFGVKLI